MINTYEIVMNQARLLKSATNTTTNHIDDAVTTQLLTVTYVNNDNTGLLESATGSGTWATTDPVGEKVSGTIEQTYDQAVIDRTGQAKVLESLTLAKEPTEVTYNRITKKFEGTLPTAAHVNSISVNKYDELGSLLEAYSKSRRVNVAGEITEQEQTATYTTYTDGPYKGLRQEGHIFGSTKRLGTNNNEIDSTEFDTVEHYTILPYKNLLGRTVNRARRSDSVTNSNTQSRDNSDNKSNITTLYTYTDDGKLKSARGFGVLSLKLRLDSLAELREIVWVCWNVRHQPISNGPLNLSRQGCVSHGLPPSPCSPLASSGGEGEPKPAPRFPCAPRHSPWTCWSSRSTALAAGRGCDPSSPNEHP